jgi:hypothetical protein
VPQKKLRLHWMSVTLRRILRFGALALLVVITPHLLHAAYAIAGDRMVFRWSETRWDSAGLAPDPGSTPEPVIQIYAARAFGWKGIFAVHSWISFKRAGAAAYERYEVVGWRVRRGGSAIRQSRHPPDGYWAGHAPALLLDRRGAGVGPLIDRVVDVIADYPHAATYRTWPGPNSNTFVAAIARSVPELGLELPPTALGKDFLAGWSLVGTAPSGQGIQLSLLGMAGLTLAPAEGLEINILGCTFGIDPGDRALKLPGFGSISLTD